MTGNGNSGSRQEFACAFGDALDQYLRTRGIGQNDAARLFGLKDKNGKPNKARLNTYCHDSPKGKRPSPDAEILYLACTKLEGFHFDYKGYRVTAVTINGKHAKTVKPLSQQLSLHFDRQFNLTDTKGIPAEHGAISVKLKRHPRRVEISLSLKATAP